MNRWAVHHWKGAGGLVLAASLALSAGCQGGGADGEVSPSPESTASELPEVPEGAARVFEGSRGDLGEYAVGYMRIVDGEATVDLWLGEVEDPEDEPEVHVFSGAEGDTFDLGGHTFTFVEVNGEHEPPYVTLSMAE